MIRGMRGENILSGTILRETSKKLKNQEIEYVESKDVETTGDTGEFNFNNSQPPVRVEEEEEVIVEESEEEKLVSDNNSNDIVKNLQNYKTDKNKIVKKLQRIRNDG